MNEGMRHYLYDFETTKASYKCSSSDNGRNNLAYNDLCSESVNEADRVHCCPKAAHCVYKVYMEVTVVILGDYYKKSQ